MNDSEHNLILFFSIIMFASLIIIPFSTGFLLGIIPEVRDLGEVWKDIYGEITVKTTADNRI